MKPPAVVVGEKRSRMEDFPPPVPGTLQEICYRYLLSCILDTRRPDLYKCGPTGQGGRFGWYERANSPAGAVYKALRSMEGVMDPELKKRLIALAEEWRAQAGRQVNMGMIQPAQARRQCADDLDAVTETDTRTADSSPTAWTKEAKSR